MPDDPTRPERPLPERIPLGKASRMLGVDPDTLRRWADEGRVPASITPGGHRRFERRAIERLLTARRASPLSGLARVGDSSTRLSAAYRRRYGELHGDGSDLRAWIPSDERTIFRDNGRRLVDALVRHLDEAGPGRRDAEHQAMDLAAQMGDRLAGLGVSLGEGVTLFVAARRPFVTELGVVARRRGVDAARIGRLYEQSSGLLDQLLLAFIAAYGAGSGKGLGDGAPGDGAGGSPAGRSSSGHTDQRVPDGSGVGSPAAGSPAAGSSDR